MRGLNKLREKDINQIVEVFKNKEITDKFSNLVKLDDIKKNNYNLIVSRYVDTYDDDLINLEDIADDRVVLLDKLDKTNKKIDGFNIELNLDEKLKL